MENSKPRDLAALVYSKLKHNKSIEVLPAPETLDNLFDVLFYLSMCKEESDLINVTVTFIDPQNPDPNPPRKNCARTMELCGFC